MLNKLLLSEALCWVAVEVPRSRATSASLPTEQKRETALEMIGLTIEQQTRRLAAGAPVLICCDDVPSSPTSRSPPQVGYTWSFWATHVACCYTYIRCGEDCAPVWPREIKEKLSQLIKNTGLHRCVTASKERVPEIWENSVHIGNRIFLSEQILETKNIAEVSGENIGIATFGSNL